MKIMKSYFSKGIFVIWCLVAIVYGQCCYAMLIYDNREAAVLFIEFDGDDKIVDEEKVWDIIERFTLAEGRRCFLDIHQVSLTPGALQMLLDAIKANGILSGLILRKCGFSSEDIGRIAGSLQGNNLLTELVIVDNNLNALNVGEIAAVLPGTRLISLSLVGERSMDEISAQILAPILERTRLVSLNLGFGDFADEPLVMAGGAALLRISNLQGIREVLNRNRLINRSPINILYRLMHRELDGDVRLSLSLPETTIRSQSSTAVNSNSSGNAGTSSLGESFKLCK